MQTIKKEARKSRPVRMTDAEWAKCKALGGAAFIREKIKSAKVGHNLNSTTPKREEIEMGLTREQYDDESLVQYNEQYDAYYYVDTGVWAEKKCEDKTCTFCKARPNNALEISCQQQQK